MDSEELNYIDLVKSVSNDMQVPTRLAFDSSNNQAGRDIDMELGYLHADMNLPDKIIVHGNNEIDSPSRNFQNRNGDSEGIDSTRLNISSRPNRFSNSLTDYPNSLMLSQDDLDTFPTNPKASLFNVILFNLKKVSKSVTELFNTDLQRLNDQQLSPMNNDLYQLPSHYVDLDMIRNHIRKMDLRFRRLEALEEARTNRDTAILLSMFGMFTISLLSYLFGGRRR